MISEVMLVEISTNFAAHKFPNDDTIYELPQNFLEEKLPTRTTESCFLEVDSPQFCQCDQIFKN